MTQFAGVVRELDELARDGLGRRALHALDGEGLGVGAADGEVDDALGHGNGLGDEVERQVTNVP